MSNDKIKPAPVVVFNTAFKTPAKGEKCPMCAKLMADAFKPFCSKRCADLDLGKWLGDGYSIPTEDVPGYGEEGEGED